VSVKTQLHHSQVMQGTLDRVKPVTELSSDSLDEGALSIVLFADWNESRD
jgi:hypothetical protein